VAVGAPATSAAIVSALVLDPIPVRHPEQLVSLGGLAYGAGLDDPAAYWSQAKGLESLGLFRAGDIRDSDATGDRWTRIAEVSGRFFQVFLVSPARGRALRREDEAESPDVAVVSYAYWRARLSARLDVLQCLIRLGGRLYTIVGVAPPGFDFPPGTQAWIPRARLETLRPNLVEGASELAVISRPSGFVGRVKPGATPQQVKGQLEALLIYANETLSAKTGIKYGELIAVAPLVDSMSSTFRATLSTLLAGAVIVLIVATANCALYVFGASIRRRTELAVRQVLGAPPSRISCRLIGGAVTVGIVSGMLGLLVSVVLLRVARQSLHALGVELNAREPVPLIAFGLSLALGLLSGLLGGITPALRARRPGIVASLTSLSASGLDKRDRTFRRGFTVIQIGAAVVLSLGAMATLSNLMRLEALDLGQDWTRVAVVRFWMPREPLVGVDIGGVHRDLLDDTTSLRGVVSAAITSKTTIASRDRGFLEVRSEDARTMASRLEVTGEHFRVMRIPVEEGRALTTADAFAVAVNQTLAHILWKEGSPIGQSLYLAGNRTPLNVVGVARDTKTVDEGLRRVPELYTPFAHRAPEPPGPAIRAVLVTSCGSSCPEVLKTLHQRLVHRAGLTVYAAGLGADSITRAQQPARVRAFLWMAYAVMTVGIALVGVGAMVSCVVTHRRLEVGIRLAMGSTRKQAVWLIARGGVICACVGIVLGAVVWRWLEAVSRTSIVGVESSDWSTTIQDCALVLGCSTVASIIPAIRISGNEPLELLRRP
jgi:putative ABC transport system permease protein